MELRSFIRVVSIVLNIALLFTLEYVIRALYLHGAWVTPIVFAVLTGGVVCAYVVGRQQIKQSTLPDKAYHSQKSDFYNSLSFGFLIVYFLIRGNILLSKSAVSLGFKVAYSLLVLLYMALTIANIWYTRHLWLRSQQIG